jgi:hypothetical protein
MAANNFSPPRPESKPAIYANEDTNQQYRGMLKVGYPHFTPPATDRKPLNEIMAVENFAQPWE